MELRWGSNVSASPGRDQMIAFVSSLVWGGGAAVIAEGEGRLQPATVPMTKDPRAMLLEKDCTFRLNDAPDHGNNPWGGRMLWTLPLRRVLRPALKLVWRPERMHNRMEMT